MRPGGDLERRAKDRHHSRLRSREALVWKDGGAHAPVGLGGMHPGALVQPEVDPGAEDTRRVRQVERTTLPGPCGKEPVGGCLPSTVATYLPRREPDERGRAELEGTGPLARGRGALGAARPRIHGERLASLESRLLGAGAGGWRGTEEAGGAERGGAA